MDLIEHETPLDEEAVGDIVANLQEVGMQELSTFIGDEDEQTTDVRPDN